MIANKIQPRAFCPVPPARVDCAGGVYGGRPRDTDPDGNPNVFNLKRNEDGVWLNNNWAKPDNHWNPENKFVFRLR